MNKLIIISVIILVFIFGSYSSSKRNVNQIEYKVINDEYEAIDLANKITGFKVFDKSLKNDDLNIIVDKIEYNNVKTIFLSDTLKNRIVWRIRYKDIILNFDRTTEEDDNKCPRNYNVYIDSNTGQLLEIITDNEDGLSNVGIDKNDIDIRKSPLKYVVDTYSRLPINPPKISLYEALNSCKFYPVLAEGIKAVYVESTFSAIRSKTPVPVWVISMSGIPSLSTNDTVNHDDNTIMKCIIDAIDGKLYFMQNEPAPIPYEDSIKIQKSH